VFGPAECYSDSSSTCDVYDDTRPETDNQSRFHVSQQDRSKMCNKGSYASEKHKSAMHDSGRMREACAIAKVSSDLECLSSIPSETAKCEQLSLDARKVYAELHEICNKLKVL